MVLLCISCFVCIILCVIGYCCIGVCIFFGFGWVRIFCGLFLS